MEKMKEVGASQLAEVKVVGVYGVGGIGKTTTCKRLCNELSNDFEGRVCHIELKSELKSLSTNSKELLQEVLIKLTKKSQEAIQQLDEGECKEVLFKNLLKQKTFLAIDNVWDNVKSIKQALVFLKAPSHPDSFVLVTTRAPRTLELLGVDGVACLEMPELGQGDARNLFLHYAANGQQFTSEDDVGFVDTCVRRCYFSKGDGGGFHYHPLALEALGRQLGCRGKNPFEWAQILSSVWNFNAISGENEVFGVLRSSFDLLRPIEQALFMDVGIFLQHFFLDIFVNENSIIWLEHLCAVHKKDEQEMQCLLNDLKGKGLLQDANLSLGRISMHDLYREFVVLEAKGKLVEAISIGDQKWVHIDMMDGDLSELEVTPIGGCWVNLTRLSIQEYDDRDDDDQIVPQPIESLVGDGPIAHPFESLDGIEWKYFSNVLVLQLCGLNIVKGTLNLKGMKCLRSLWIHHCVERFEGLEGLANLTLFEWRDSFCGYSKRELIVGRFSRSLKYLDIRVGGVLLGLDVLIQCHNLCKVTLKYVEVGVQLDLSNCWSLKRVKLSHIHKLQTLLLPSMRMGSRLKSLDLGSCPQLVDIRGLAQHVYLEYLNVSIDALKEVPNLLSLTKLRTLTTDGGALLTKLHFPCQLQEFHHQWGKSIKAPNLNGLNQLQVLDLNRSRTLACLLEMGDLPTLRALDLSHCVRLQWLPNLNKSRNLEELDLDGCDALELHENDIQMLVTLPLLHPVHFSSSYKWGTIKLDLAMRKVLQFVGIGCPPKSSLNWMEGEWEEKELGQPPIKLGKRGF